MIRDNLRAAGLMTASMLFFALEDACVRALSAHLPVGQILASVGLLGGAVFWIMLRREGGALWTRDLLVPQVMARNVGELFGAIGFVTAIALTGLTTASAILQVLPLSLMLGAALFLGESVGWRRWTAIAVGLAGVMLVLRPGLDGFQPGSLFALLSVAGLTLRDLATRRMPRHVRSSQISASAFFTLVPAGLVLALGARTPFVMLTATEYLLLLAMVVAAILGYATLVMATRSGEASVIAPIRYTRLVFALILGVALFGERPDAATLAGAAIICASGAFAMWRDLVRRRA